MVSSGVKLSEVRSISSSVAEWSTTDRRELVRDRLIGGDDDGDQAETTPLWPPW